MMRNIPIYIDRELLVAVAAKLVGVLSEDSRGRSGGAGLNWLIQGTVSAETGHTVARDIRELLPEDVLYSIYDKVTNRFNVADCIEAFARTGEQQLLPGSVVSAQGILSFPDLNVPQYDPFNPPTISVKTFSVHGEK